MKTRKLLALVLALAMLLSIFVIPTAADVTPAAAAEILGLLKGDSDDGVTAEYLAKRTTRAQGLMITLRARGLEEEAGDFEGEDNFDDAGDNFWTPYLAYAFANPELGWIGYGDGTFRPQQDLTGLELVKVMLAVLGYEQGEDFEWEDVEDFAETIGLTVFEDPTNDNFAATLVEALVLETKDGDVLVDALIEDGVLDAEKAVEAGVKEEAEVAAFTAKVTGAKKVTVTFAEAQDTALVLIRLRKGAVGQAATVTWSTDKKVATLTRSVNLTKGDYTVTVGDDTADFTVAADETATELVMAAGTMLYKKAGEQDLNIHLLNQYGEKMNVSGVVGGSSIAPVTFADTTGKLTLPATLPAAGTTVSVFAYYAAKNFTLNETLTIVDDQFLATIEFVGPIAQGKQSKDIGRLTAGTADNTIAFKAKDQYGQTLNLTTIDAAKYNIVMTGAEVDAVADGKLTLKNLKAGTFTVRAIVMASGSVSDVYAETVYAVATLASFEIEAPEAIYEGEAAKFKVVGTDQYGEAIDVTADGTWAITAVSVAGVNITAKTFAKNEIALTFDKNGAADLYFTTDKGLNTTVSVTVLAKKAIASIAAVGLGTEAVLEGVTIELDMTKTILNDQYGNKIDPAGGAYKFYLFRLDEKVPFGKAGTDTDATVALVDDTPDVFQIKGHKKGTDQFVMVYANEDPLATNTNAYVEYRYDFALTVVEAKDIVSYEFKVADEMYGKSAGREAGHDLALDIIGKTANGTTVALVNYDGVALYNGLTYTVSNDKADIAGFKFVRTNDIGDKDADVTIKAWSATGVEVASKTIVLKAAAPAVASIALKFDDKAAPKTVTLSAKDQYGVAIAPPAGKFYASIPEVVLANETATKVDVAATKAGVVRFVSTDGAWTAEVAVK